ncbi:S10 family peptidase [Brachybacterium huguangmaarense]
MADDAQPRPDAPDSAPELHDSVSVTAHALDLPGGPLAYTATAGTYVLREEPEGEAYSRGAAYAEIFAVSYVAQAGADTDTDPDTPSRPVVFAFNGGPGSSTMWLHLGLLGPRRVLPGDAHDPVAPPYRLVDNAESILAVADLVCIDPMTTGFSRPAAGAKPDRHHGFSADRDLITAFIIQWLTANDRWDSAIHLLGESYGTTRGAAVAAQLMDRHHVATTGLALVSPVLDFATIDFTPGNDAPFVHYLPTYAAIAHAHGLHPGRSLEQVVDEAESFAEQDYPGILARGLRLSDDERREAAERIAVLIGVDPAWVERADLRPEHMAFLAELLRDERRVVGRIDGRFTAPAGDALAGQMETDPSIDQLAPAFVAGINRVLRHELGFTTDVVYEGMSSRVHPWSYKEFEGRSIEVATDLARTMRKLPALRVFVAHGYHDAATPFHASEHVLAHLAIPREDYEERIRIAYYEAGHMMYCHEPSRLALSEHLREFVTAGGER